MAALFDEGDPTRAYFGTDARIHQVLIGALGAMLVIERPVRATRATSAIGLACLAGLAWMTWTVTGTTDWYYRGGSALAAVLTVGVIVAVFDEGGACARALSLPPLTALGLISYGVYLWHWPVIVLLGPDVIPLEGVALALVQATLAIGIAVLSYVLLERPIRRGELGSWTFTPGRVARLVPTSMVAVALLIVVAGIGRQADPLAAASEEGAVVLAGSIEAPRARTGAEPGDEFREVQSIGLVGDSVAWLWSGELAQEAEARGLQLISAAKAGCQVGYEGLYTPRGSPADENGPPCVEIVAAAHQELRALAPDIVLWHDINASYARMSDAGELLVEGPGWEAHLFAAWDEALAALEGPDTTIAIIIPPWRSVDAPGCDGAARRERCEQVQAQDARIRASTVRYLERHADDPRVVGIDIDDLVCPAMPCPTEVGGVELRKADPDLTHFTGEGARWLVPHLIDRAIEAARG
jgi:hypothetical protein